MVVAECGHLRVKWERGKYNPSSLLHKGALLLTQSAVASVRADLIEPSTTKRTFFPATVDKNDTASKKPKDF